MLSNSVTGLASIVGVLIEQITVNLIGTCAENGRASDRIRLIGLLDSMRQFVGKQIFATLRLRPILAAAENDVIADGISASIDPTCRLPRARICMDPDTAEVVAKTRLEKVTGFKVECPTA